MSVLPDRDELHDSIQPQQCPQCARIIAAYSDGVLKSRDEMNIDAAEGALHATVFDLDAQSPPEAVRMILDAAFGKVADE